MLKRKCEVEIGGQTFDIRFDMDLNDREDWDQESTGLTVTKILFNPLAGTSVEIEPIEFKDFFEGIDAMEVVADALAEAVDEDSDEEDDSE